MPNQNHPPTIELSARTANTVNSLVRKHKRSAMRLRTIREVPRPPIAAGVSIAFLATPIVV